MVESKQSKKVLDVDDGHEFSHWQLPDVTQSNDDKPSNMFGRKSAQYQAQSQGEMPEATMPTMAQIEDIRAAAEQEGFEQGKQEGYQQGLEQGRLDGLTQGHEEGFAQGEQQGLEEGLAKAKDMLEQFSQILSQFNQPLAILDSEVEAELLNMTLTLARSVVQQELKMHPEHISAAIRQGVDSLPIKDQKVKLRLHTEDAALVNQLYSKEHLIENDWLIEQDPSLQRGDVIIQSFRSSVDLTLAKRFEQVFANIEGQVEQLNHNNNQAKSAENTAYQTHDVEDINQHWAEETAKLENEHKDENVDMGSQVEVDDIAMQDNGSIDASEEAKLDSDQQVSQDTLSKDTSDTSLQDTQSAVSVEEASEHAKPSTPTTE